MSKYTTGEIAKLCRVTVRTVQYYDTRGILVPTELSEGGRRLYSDEDLGRMRVICFLRDLGLSIDAVSALLSEDDSDSVISLLLDQREEELKRDVEKQKENLAKIAALKNGMKKLGGSSVESIADMAYVMTNKQKLKKLHAVMLLAVLPFAVLQWGSIILWITTGIWWLFAVWAVLVIPYAVFFSRWYFKKTAYICPRCHNKFQPKFSEAVFAAHTPAARKLTCPNCGHRGFCVETAAGSEEEDNLESTE